MSVGTRFGVMTGYVLATLALGLIHGYRPQLLGDRSVWLVPLAPVVTCLAVELAGWLRRRMPLLSRLFLLVGVLSAGGWSLWLYGLLAEGEAKTHLRFGVPSVLALVYLAAVMSGAWRRSGRAAATSEDRSATQPELVSH